MKTTPNTQFTNATSRISTESEQMDSKDSSFSESEMVVDKASTRSSLRKRNRQSISKVAKISDQAGVSAAATATIATATLEAHGD